MKSKYYKQGNYIKKEGFGSIIGGLIVAIVFQAIAIAIFFILAIIISWSTRMVNAANGDGFDDLVNSIHNEIQRAATVIESFVLFAKDKDLLFIKESLRGMEIAFWILFIVAIFTVTLSSIALKHVYRAKKGYIKYNSTLITFVGVIALITTLIGGILILVGVSSLNHPQPYSSRFENNKEHSKRDYY